MIELMESLLMNMHLEPLPGNKQKSLVQAAWFIMLAGIDSVLHRFWNILEIADITS